MSKMNVARERGFSVEMTVLQMKGTNGTLRIDLEENEIRKMLEKGGAGV